MMAKLKLGTKLHYLKHAPCCKLPNPIWWQGCTRHQVFVIMQHLLDDLNCLTYGDIGEQGDNIKSA